MQQTQLAIAALLLSLCTTSAWGQDYQPLVQRLPGDTNVLVLIDAQKVRSSPMAEREGWTQAAAARLGRQPVIALPGAKLLVVGAELDPGDLRVLWDVSVMKFGNAPRIETIEQASGGRREELAGLQAVWAPTSTYFVQFDSATSGAVYPANRQFAARWIQSMPRIGAGPASRYLRDVLATSAGAAPIVFAVDLQDAVSAARVMDSFVIQPPQFTSSDMPDLAALSRLLATIKGLQVQVNVTDHAAAEARLDFGADCTIMRGAAKPFLIDLLTRNGLYLADVNGWNVIAEGNRIIARGNLTGDGLRRLLSIVSAPSVNLVQPARPTAETATESNLQAKVYASQNYYHAVSRIIDRSKPADVLSQSAAWLTRDAREINDLPILNVDPDLVRWGGDVSGALIEMSQIFNEGQARVQARSAAIQYPVGPFNYSPQDPAAYQEANEQRRAAWENARNQQRMAANEEKARTLQQSRDVLSKLFKQREVIRAQMVQRYQAEF